MANLTDADKVLRNDTGKDIVTQLTAIKTAIENGGGGGGGDYANKNIAVTFDTETSYNEGDYVIYNSDLYRAKNDVSAGTWTGSTDWESVTVGEQLNLKAFTVVCTQSQYDTWSGTTPKSFPLLNAYYIITDAPNLNATASDIEYSSGVTVKQAIDNGVGVSRPTVEVTTGNTLMYDNSVKYGKMVSVTCAIKVTASANQYTHIATITEKPVNIVTVPSVNNVNATYCGMINISNTDGHINLFPLTALSSNTISFSVTYYQA